MSGNLFFFCCHNRHLWINHSCRIFFKSFYLWWPDWWHVSEIQSQMDIVRKYLIVSNWGDFSFFCVASVEFWVFYNGVCVYGSMSFVWLLNVFPFINPLDYGPNFLIIQNWMFLHFLLFFFLNFLSGLVDFSDRNVGMNVKSDKKFQ